MIIELLLRIILISLSSGSLVHPTGQGLSRGLDHVVGVGQMGCSEGLVVQRCRTVPPSRRKSLTSVTHRCTEVKNPEYVTDPVLHRRNVGPGHLGGTTWTSPCRGPESRLVFGVPKVHRKEVRVRVYSSQWSRGDRVCTTTRTPRTQPFPSFPRLSRRSDVCQYSRKFDPCTHNDCNTWIRTLGTPFVGVKDKKQVVI